MYSTYPQHLNLSKKGKLINFLWNFIRNIFVLGAVGLVLVLVINYTVVSKSSDYIFNDITELPEADAIIVLGAYVREDNLSLVLEDRVLAAIALYEHEISPKLLLSGDHGRKYYDEVNGMRRFVLNRTDIPEEDIFLDHAGFDTYDSMYRAKDVFLVKKAIIVTQEFHINRAVYIARQQGIEAYGYSVNQDKYKISLQVKWFLRESLARVKAFIDVSMNAEPKYLGNEIPISGDGRLSWDIFDE